MKSKQTKRASKRTSKKQVRDLSKINLKSPGTGYEFVSTYKGKSLKVKPTRKPRRKTSSKKTRKTNKRKTNKRKTSKKRHSKKQKGAGCQSSNQYLFVQGTEIPESQYAPALKIDDQFAKLNQDITQYPEIVVEHPHLLNKFN